MFNINKKMKFVFFAGVFTLCSVNLSAAPAEVESGITFENISSSIDFKHDSSPDILQRVIMDPFASNYYQVYDVNDDGIVDDYGPSGDPLVNAGKRYDSGTGFGGIAYLDYDGDGDQDVYLTNGIDNPAGLFRNDGEDANGNLVFTDVTDAAGLTDLLGGSGVVAADLDNDGDPDLITAGDGGLLGGPHSANALYENNGDGTFTYRGGSDPTLPTLNAKAADPAMHDEDRDIYSTSASIAVADLDNDGDLDVFIGAHGIFAAGFDQYERARPQREHRLYRNDGNFVFTEISDSAGILIKDLEDDKGGTREANGNDGSCANAFSDYDKDGDLDLFLGNCNVAGRFGALLAGQPSEGIVQLLENRSDSSGIKFVDVSHEVGLGKIGGWMGIAFLDYDKDGNMDVFVSNTGTTFDPRNPVGQNGLFGIGQHGLFRNKGDGTFEKDSIVIDDEIKGFSWGSTAKDYDNDGNVDIQFNGGLSVFAYNLDMMRMPDLDPSTPEDDGPDMIPSLAVMRASDDGYGGSGYVYLNNGDGTFTDDSTNAGVDFLRQGLITSGSASGDLDNDGFPDLIVQTNVDKTKLSIPLPLFHGSVPYLICMLPNGDLVPPPSPYDPLFDPCIVQDAGQPGGLHPMWFNDIMAPPPIGFIPAGGLRGSIREDVFASIMSGLPQEVAVPLHAIPFFNMMMPLLDMMGISSLLDPADVTTDGHIVVLRNGGNSNNWIGLELQGTVSNRDAVGARVTVVTQYTAGGGENSQLREIGIGASYLSSNDKRITVGLGAARAVKDLSVVWPSGCEERFQPEKKINEYHTLIEGEGHNQVNCQ